MKIFLLFLFTSLSVSANPLAFRIQFFDRKVKVISPVKETKQFAVIVENKSLSDLHAKFSSNGKDMVFFSVKSTQFKTIEFRNDSGGKVQFIPMNPPFQEVVLEFGKDIYEIPTKN